VWDTTSVTFELNALSTHILEKSALSIYPNPVLNELRINVPSYYNTVKLSIYDMRGALLRTIEQSGQQLVIINCSAMQEGAYKIVMTDGIRISEGTFLVVQ
jgi:surface polysaccharide O-acyltransferase-like enzyme